MAGCRPSCRAVLLTLLLLLPRPPPCACSAIMTPAAPAAPLRMAPLGVYCGSAGGACVETTPIIWQGKLAVVERHQPFRVRWQSHAGLEPTNATASNNSVIIEIPDSAWLQFASAIVVDDTLWVFGTNDVAAAPPKPNGKPRTQVWVHWSSAPDLSASSWRSSRVLQLPQNGSAPADPREPLPWWNACNTSPTKGRVGGKDAFVLALEVTSPPTIVPSSVRNEKYISVFAVCYQCAATGDLSYGWEVLDPLTHVYRRAVYSAAPTLRWFDGWFYIIVLEKAVPRPDGPHCHTTATSWPGCLAQHIARSKDLVNWQESTLGSPAGQILGWPDGNVTTGPDHHIIPGSILDDFGTSFEKDLARYANAHSTQAQKRLCPTVESPI